MRMRLWPIFRFIIASIIAWLFSQLFVGVINMLFPTDQGEKELVNPITKDWYVNAFFTKKNRGSTQLEPCDDIVIVNVVDSVATRSDFAKIIRKVAAGHPRVIGLDVYFQELDDSASNELLAAIREVKDSTKIVAASYYIDSENKIYDSFFVPQLDSLISGLVNHPDYTSLITTYRGYPTFSAQIAKACGCDLHGTYGMNINYRLKLFGSSFFEKRERIDEFNEDLNDRIVLIGSTEDPNDIKNLPCIVKESNQMPGIEMLAYEISSFLSMDKPKNKYFSPLVNLNKFGNLIICFIALAIYLLLLEAFKWIFGMRKTTKRLWPIFKPLLLIGVEILIIYACFAYTDCSQKIPDIALFVISIIFIEDIFDIIPDYKVIIQKSKNVYEKISSFCCNVK